MNKPNHIVFTTIHEPIVLNKLYENISQYGHLDDVICWVVGDYKTPLSCTELCRSISKQGLDTRYLDITSQDKWGKKFPEFYQKIPYNNETRRNIGYLFALEHGCERLISIDDDNFPIDDDFIGEHAKTGTSWHGDLIEESIGFYNICEHLTIYPDRLIFPRGFPFELRGKRNNYSSVLPSTEAIIGVSSGLWLDEPDVDAITRLNGAVESKEYHGPPSLVLNQNTWSPINTQNTSVTRQLIPGFFCIPMGHDVPGGRIERYGDIWSGYFLQSLIQDTPYHICFGRPIVKHQRNQHSCLEDLRHEYWGMILTDWLILQLRENFKPIDTALIERIIALSVFIESIAETTLPKWCSEEVRLFIIQTANTLCLWAKVCEQIIGKTSI